MFKHILLLSILSLSSATSFAAAATFDQELADFSRAYQVAAYDVEDTSARAKLMDDLLVKAVDLKARYPQRGLPHAWIGWLKFNAMYSQTDPAAMMPMLQDALVNLEKAVEIEPNCCGESAYVSLAIIYQVPFTGKDQSEIVRKYFAKAFAVDPNGPVTNTRYAGFLMRSGDLENALKHANAALAAPPLVNRAGEDRAVRQQAQDFIEQINDRMKRAKAANTEK